VRKDPREAELNVGRGALRLWVVFTVLWISAVGFLWQTTVQDSIQNGCWSQTSAADLPPPVKPVDPWANYRIGQSHEPPKSPCDLYEDYRPLPMVQGIVEEALIVPSFLLVVGLMFAWAFKGFRGASERERTARAFGRQP
jgi:hypothetical protein